MEQNRVIAAVKRDNISSPPRPTLKLLSNVTLCGTFYCSSVVISSCQPVGISISQGETSFLPEFVSSCFQLSTDSTASFVQSFLYR